MPGILETIYGPKKKKVVLGKLIRVTAGGRHAWYESNVGPVKKPYRKPERE
jgi:hypothetical protein